MKCFIIIALFSCTIITGMEQNSLTLTVFKTWEWKNNDSIVSLGKIEETQQEYFVEKRIPYNTFSIARKIPIKDIYTAGYYYEEIENEPAVLALFEKEIESFQHPQNKEYATLSLLRTASSKLSFSKKK